MGTDFLARIRAYLASCWMAAPAEPPKPKTAEEWTAQYAPLYAELVEAYAESPPNMAKCIAFCERSDVMCQEMRLQGLVPMVTSDEAGRTVVRCVPTPAKMPAFTSHHA